MNLGEGYGNSWLKYFILWYLCDRSSTYPKPLDIGKIQLRKENIGKSGNPIRIFTDKVRKKLAELPGYEPTETERGGSDTVAEPIPAKTEQWREWPRQLILWGAPGTGKSYAIDRKINELTDKAVYRMTFHPATDYGSFVGAYKPTMEGDKIVYRFQPQSLLKAYEEACTNPDKPVFLIIEEINRGNCAHIFGDIFQLLDREENLTSKYPITPHEDIKLWLKSTKIEEKNQLKLPPNLFIWATMNSSDQSLYKLDSAFQRRWLMRYTPINSTLNKALIRIDNDTTVKWADFLDNVNGKMLGECEDRRMGPFFAKPDPRGEISAEDFVGKVLSYLYRTVFGIYNIEANPAGSLTYDDFFNPAEDIFGNKLIATDKLKDFFTKIDCILLDGSGNPIAGADEAETDDSEE